MQNIGIHTIEDCIEILAGIQKHNLTFIVKSSDSAIINSIAKQVNKGVALTDRQYNLMKSKLFEYKSQFENNNIIGFDRSLTKLRIELRTIDRSKTIKVVDSLDVYDKDNLKGENKWIEIRFPFKKSHIVLIQSIKKDNTEYVHINGTHVHYFLFNENYVKQIGDLFFDKDFVVDPILLNIYNDIKKINENIFEYVSCIKDNVIYNNHNLSIDDNLDFIKVVDRHRRLGLINYDKSSNASLQYKIAYRDDVFYHSRPSQEPINNLIEALHLLDRYPLLVILDETKAESQIFELYDYFKNIVSNSQQSVLFRQEGDTDFNNFVKNKSLNNWVDLNTKIVYISTNKLPKILINSEWVPNATLSYNSNINRNLNIYTKEKCDLIIFREEDLSAFRLNSKYYANY